MVAELSMTSSAESLIHSEYTLIAGDYSCVPARSRQLAELLETHETKKRFELAFPVFVKAQCGHQLPGSYGSCSVGTNSGS